MKKQAYIAINYVTMTFDASKSFTGSLIGDSKQKKKNDFKGTWLFNGTDGF